MSQIHICLDESGDLGWKFVLPYRYGGSSRHLTISSVLFDPSVEVKLNRFIKKLYIKHKWPTKIERKWSAMNDMERDSFADRACKLIRENPKLIEYRSITVYKQNVMGHIRSDPNKLYNYMIGISLLNSMTGHDEVILKPDDRSIKVLSGNALEDYLKTTLWCKHSASTDLSVINCDSSKHPIIQFSDMLSGVVQSHYEDGNSDAWRKMGRYMTSEELWFP